MALLSQSVESNSELINRRNWRLLLSKPIFQVIGGVFVAAFGPAYFRIWATEVTLVDQWLNTTLLIVSAVIVLSYFTFTNLSKFPNVTEGAFIFLTVTMWYSIGGFILLFSRLNYSGYLFLVSYVISLFWFYFLYFWTLRARRPNLAIVPGGAVDNLISLPDVEWSVLKEPRLNGDNFNGVVADLRAKFTPEWERFIADVSLAGIPVFHSKQAFEALTGRVEIEHLSENTFGSLIPGLAYVQTKQVLDFILALALTPLLSPFFLVIAVAIRWDSPGPILFRQERVGYRGNTFTVYKFRTMVHEPDRVEREAEPHNVMTADDDNRVTRVGRWLRRKRLDEFPQMINILRGEMSFIGPRPEAVALSRWYQRELPFYVYRHVVRPGISGWAQINQGHVTDVDLVLGKLHYDFYYIKNFSPWLDVLIILKTLGIMVRGIGAR